jgi:hypothetical protein
VLCAGSGENFERRESGCEVGASADHEAHESTHCTARDQSMKGFGEVREPVQSFHSGAPTVGQLDTYSGAQNDVCMRLIEKNMIKRIE